MCSSYTEVGTGEAWVSCETMNFARLYPAGLSIPPSPALLLRPPQAPGFPRPDVCGMNEC